MSKQNNLDDFFKDKFNDREFEFKNSYWEDAERLIEAEDKRDWKKPFLWFMIGVFFMGGLWLTMSKFSSKDQADITTNTSQTNMSVSDLASDQKNKNLTDHQNEQVTEGNVSMMNKEEEEEKQNSKIETTQIYNTVLEEPKIKNNNTSIISTQDFPVLTSPVIPHNAIDNKLNILEGNTLNNSFTKPILKNQALNYSLKENTNLLLQNNFIPPTVDKSRENIKLQQRSILNTFDFIEILNLRLADNETKIHKDQVPKLKINSRKFNLGLIAGGFTHAAENQGNAFYGGTGGITLKYRFLPFLSINTDLTYRLVKGDFEETQTNIQTNYGFGQTTNEYSLRPKSMHQISIPVYAQLGIGRSLLEGGITYNRLIGVRGEIKDKESLYPWQRVTMEEQLNKSKSTILSEGWIAEEGFRTDYFSLLMGYKYRLNTNMDIGLRAEYALKSILTNNESIGGVNQLSFGVHLNYYFIQ